MLVFTSTSAALGIELRSACLEGERRASVLVAESGVFGGEPAVLGSRLLAATESALTFERRRLLDDHLQTLQDLAERRGHQLGFNGVDTAAAELDPIAKPAASGGIIRAPVGARPGRGSHGSAVRRHGVARPPGRAFFSEVHRMTAFVVDAAHIAAILSTAINGPNDRRPGSQMGWQPPYVHEILGVLEPLGADNASAAGAALMEECIASVSYRYPDMVGELPGPMPTPLAEQYEWTDLGSVMSAIEACKAIACFEFQSCEHPGWARSGVRAFCSELRRSLVSCMQGYEEAPWEWDVELALSRARAWPQL